LRIKEEFKKSSYFWLPSSPERIIPGTLSITDGGNIDLELFGVFDNNDKLARIIGHIENHGLVTLDDCFYKNQTISVPGISKSSIFVNNALIGVAYDDKELVLLNTFRFSIEGIDEWVGLSGIKVKSQIEKPTVSITYSQPEDISLNLKNGMNLLITFAPALSGYPNTTEAKITQKTYFKLVSEQERPLKTLPQQLIKLLPSSVLPSIKPSV